VPFLTPDLTVRRVDAATWQTTHSITYQGAFFHRGRQETFTIPARFRTDFATVPRVLRWLAPRYGIYTLAVILHDYLCVLLAQGRPQADAVNTDGLFRRVLREQGVPFVQRWLMWTGVRWGALGNSARREGWLRTAPLVLLISAVALPVVLPPVVTIGLALLAVRVTETLFRLVGLR
jgi:hypothetical protein